VFIDSFLRDYRTEPISTLVANLGSGGVDYGVLAYTHVHLDRAPQQLRNVRFRVMGDVENIPLRSASVDLVLCVGEVLNLASPERVVEEISRVAKPGALLLLEFESNKSFEFIFSHAGKGNRSLINTFHNDRDIVICILDPAYIYSLINRAGLELLRVRNFHIISALIYRITRNADVAAKFASADILLSRLPLLRHRGCNIIVGCAKR